MSTAVAHSKPLILLVDDDEDSRFLYVHYLTANSRYRVAEASDGAQGVALAAELRPDLIVMDLSLPLVDGWEAMRRLRSNHGTRDIPIVALTGHAQVKTENEPGTQFQAVLVKPCLPEALAQQVAELLRA